MVLMSLENNDLAEIKEWIVQSGLAVSPLRKHNEGSADKNKVLRDPMLYPCFLGHTKATGLFALMPELDAADGVNKYYALNSHLYSPGDTTFADRNDGFPQGSVQLSCEMPLLPRRVYKCSLTSCQSCSG